MKKIYKYYKRRLIEISGKNRSLYSKKVTNKFSYDIGKLLNNEYDTIANFIDFLWDGKKLNFELIGKNEKELIYKNLKVENKLGRYNLSIKLEDGTEKPDYLKIERAKKQELKRSMIKEVASLKALKRENEELEKETGRYELYVGYPFVEGYIGKDLAIKAPLILFPAVINVENETTVNIELKANEPIKFNKVLIYAYANAKKINVDELETDFDNLKAYGLKNIKDIVNYLDTFGIEINYAEHKGMLNFENSPEPKLGDPLQIKNYCILGRFPLTNSIYNDYEILEKQSLSTNAIDELLLAKTSKPNKKVCAETHIISNLDYAQLNTIQNLNSNSNMVIYGPPGTGKSQTIVNIIADALAKGEKVLVVSQKKAALDVVYNRLANLNAKAMQINDSDKSKIAFYIKAKQTHDLVMASSPTANIEEYDKLEKQIAKETEELEKISDVLYKVRPYGINLQQMYANSEIIGKKSADYAIYKSMLNNADIMALNFNDIKQAIKHIKEKNKDGLYYKFIEKKQVNPLIDYIKSDIEMHTLVQSQNLINKVISSRFIPFDMTKRPYARDLLAYYLEHSDDGKLKYKPLTKYISSTENPNLYKRLKASYIFLPIYPFLKHKVNLKEKEIESSFDKTLQDLKDYISEYEILKDVLEPKGYLLTCDNILSGNTMYLKMLGNALKDYVEVRDINIALKELDDTEKILLKFAYKNSDNFKSFEYIIQKFLTFRTYVEVIKLEDSYKNELAKLADFNNIKNRIVALRNEEMSINRKISLEQNNNEYKKLINDNVEESKNFLYQISKQQNLWPIRKIMNVYQKYLLKLFPCWLLSPESASQILPLKKELFDLVIFDEASQVFIENTLPCIFRGKHIVIAGDNKQLRPYATFIKRYMGNEDVDEFDYSTQAALEVESLLDLATSRYYSSNLTYHYRSRSEELINFSNYAFYNKKLQIAPNITKNKRLRPIERIKVDGKWINTRNNIEAQQVVKLLEKLLKDKNRKASIGIITFNLEQEYAIEDEIDALAERDDDFRNALILEQNRKDNGEDVSLFVKNLENVQGDERDIIIFSTGYAKNEYGKIVAHFGLLSNEGGENRLNVAITRAKEKIYVVTSIEPEELNVDGSKNIGPKLFKEYLKYVRAVSNGNTIETNIILNNLFPTVENSTADLNENLQKQVKSELENIGYYVECNIGNTSNKIPLAVYNKKKDKYLLGIEFDYSAFESSKSVLERDVYHPAFLESRGWQIFRIWSREWWLNKKKVLNRLSKILEKLK